VVLLPSDPRHWTKAKLGRSDASIVTTVFLEKRSASSLMFEGLSNGYRGTDKYQ
jgi:hypothetical protein